MEEQIINRVANSGLHVLDLEEYYPEGDRVLIDIKDQLFQGQILREKDFRLWLKENDWSVYTGKYVAIICSVEAIIPTWAYMLVAIALKSSAKRVVFGNLEDLETVILTEILHSIDWEIFRGKKVVVKGCSKVDVPVQVYVEVAQRLRSVAASIMFGEPCSTVPLFKANSGS